MRTIPVIALLLLAAGCSNELETGYKPKALGVTSEERKAYYAPAFSPEAQGRGTRSGSGQNPASPRLLINRPLPWGRARVGVGCNRPTRYSRHPIRAALSPPQFATFFPFHSSARIGNSFPPPLESHSVNTE